MRPRDVGHSLSYLVHCQIEWTAWFYKQKNIFVHTCFIDLGSANIITDIHLCVLLCIAFQLNPVY